MAIAWQKRTLWAAAMISTMPLALEGCSALGDAAQRLNARSNPPVAVVPPPSERPSAPAGETTVSREPLPAEPVSREPSRGPVALAPGITGAAAVPEPAAPPATPRAEAAAPPPAPAPVETPKSTAATPGTTAAATGPPPPMTCPPGTTGVWSEDLVRKPVYICRQLNPAR